MGRFPSGSRECECGACCRGFTGLGAFDAHRQGHRCLEPSSVGLWLATDGLWSEEPRNARLEAVMRAERGRALRSAAEAHQNDPGSRA